MVDIKYIFGNVRTGEVLDEIPLFGVSPMTKKLNDWGSFDGTFNLDRSGRQNSDMLSATIPGQCYVICEREQTPVWGGIIWSRVYQSQSKTVQMSARTFEAYSEKRIILTDFFRANTDQRNIFCDLWNLLQSAPEGNLGVTIPGTFPTVNAKDLSVVGTDRKNYLQVFSAISDGEDGFDWMIDVGKTSSGVYTKTLRIGFPNIGSVDPATLQFEYPGVITNYYATSSMSEGGTHVSVLGTGEGSSMLTSTFIHQDLINAGTWLRWDIDIARKQIGSSQAIVDSLAAQIGPQRRPPVKIHKIFVLGKQDPVYGSYGLGDACTLIIKDPLYSTPLQSVARIIATSYRPASDNGVEEVEIIFEGDNLND